MVKALSSLHFKHGNAPSSKEQERVVKELADILEQAAHIGQAHAQSILERGIAWGDGSNPLSAAWNIVTHFVSRILSWFSEQDPEEVTEEDIEAEVEDLAEKVADVEVAAAIEIAVLDTLQAQGETEVRSIAQPGACARCQANADQGPIPIGTAFASGDTTPPYHGSCKCQLSTA